MLTSNLFPRLSCFLWMAILGMALSIFSPAGAQLVSYTPLNADFETTINIRFNLNFLQSEKGKKLLGQTKGLYLWAGAGTSAGNAFEFSPDGQTNFNQPVVNGQLTCVGNNRWEITINPRTYFKVPTSKKIAILGLIVKNEDGSAQTEDIILLPGKSTSLSEVVVIANKPFIEMQPDKTVMNVQSDINAMGSSALEILQKAPGINVTGDDIIKMSGKPGVTVLIDNRPIQISTRELANFLRSLPGGTIDKIELITNPSGKYDAQGNAGIINIRLKKIKLVGTNGSVSASYTQNVHYRSNAAFNINHRSGKVNVFSNMSGDNNLQHTSGSIERKVQVGNMTKIFRNTTTDIDQNTSYNIRTGMDFYASKKHTFGLLINARGNRTPFNTPGNTAIVTNNEIDSSLITQNDNLFKTRSLNTNLNYQYEDTVGNVLNLDADYSSFKNNNDNNLSTLLQNKKYETYQTAVNRQAVATSINIYAIKADYSHPISRWSAKFETGAKVARVSTDNDLNATLLVNSKMISDTGRSNTFAYTEKISAGYANFGQRLQKFEYLVGLRLENAVINGQSTDLHNKRINKPDTQYLNIFPSLFVTYKANDSNTISMSFSRRINRPDYQSLNPFETIYDLYTSEKGNPYLRPQYTQNYEVKYAYKSRLNVAFGYNHTVDYSQTISQQIQQQTTATSDNIGSLDNAYLNISSPMQLRKWWTGYINVSGFLNHYRGNLPDGVLNQRVVGMNYYIQQNFKTGKNWTFQLSSWYNSPTTEAIFKTAWLGSVDLGIKKTILDTKMTFRLAIVDIFNTQRWQQSVQFANQDYVYKRKWESRGIRFQVSYNFGKTKYNARDRETNTDADRIKPKH